MFFGYIGRFFLPSSQLLDGGVWRSFSLLASPSVRLVQRDLHPADEKRLLRCLELLIVAVASRAAQQLPKTAANTSNTGRGSGGYFVSDDRDLVGARGERRLDRLDQGFNQHLSSSLWLL